MDIEFRGLSSVSYERASVVEVVYKTNLGIAMKELKTTVKAVMPFFQLFTMVFVLALNIGCQGNSSTPVEEAGSAAASSLYRMPDTSQCTTVSDILQITQDLTLQVSNSEVRYRSGSVPLPTPVSFGICSTGPVGSLPATRAAVFGPISNFSFLIPLEVRIDVSDAGLPSNIPSGTPFRLYRNNEITRVWDFVQEGQTNGHRVEYGIMRNGEYAVTLLSAVIDTIWNVSGVIPPTGGTLNLLSSSLVFPPGAVSGVMVSFSITQSMPAGLPDATNRVYDFGPEGLVFQAPVTLYVSFDDAGLSGEKMRPLRFYYFNQLTGTWERQPTVTDWERHRFVVTLSHFSRYAFGR